jgi:L-alanine-DL-glutamate epimerase-like enolase superfamily enzyme
MASTGIGEAGVGGGSTGNVIERQLRPMVLGEDPLLIEGLWQKMFARTRQFGRRGIVMNAISGIDIALWDIAGKVAKLPVYRLLGACRDRVEAYASGGLYQEGKSIDEVAREVGYEARPQNRGYLQQVHVSDSEEKAEKNARQFLWL